MTSYDFVLKRLLLPHLKLINVDYKSDNYIQLFCEKFTTWEPCRKCPTKSFTVYDRRLVKIMDTKIKNRSATLIISKRRFRCLNCKCVFTESVNGIKHRHKTTERFKDEILYNCKVFNNLSLVAKRNRVSDGFVAKICYTRMELELRKSKFTPWGSTIGIDEHAFRKGTYRREFVVPFVDLGRKCVRELAPSQASGDMYEAIKHIPERENVRYCVMDLSENFRSFVKGYFPNANIVADKFHVLRLIHPAIRKYRKEITGDQRKNPIRWLLLKNNRDLKNHERNAVIEFCRQNKDVSEVYGFKERIYGFYRIKGYHQARKILIRITDDMSHSKIKEIQTLRKTLLKWFEEILTYFKTGLTNARTEGFNRKCKLIQRKAYGFKSFKNYRYRVLYETV